MDSKVSITDFRKLNKSISLFESLYFYFKGDFMMMNEELVELYQNGDKKALNELINKNKGMVYKLVNKFYVEGTNSISKDDLKQEGFLGLIVAAEKYKHDMKNKAQFITYAVYWIYNYINRFITKRNTNEEISLNNKIGDSENTEIGDLLESDEKSYEILENEIDNKQLRKELSLIMIECNTLEERNILKLIHGWDNNEHMKYVEIGKLMNKDVSKIKYIENRAYAKIRKSSWGKEKAREIFNIKNEDSLYRIDNKVESINFAQRYLEM